MRASLQDCNVGEILTLCRSVSRYTLQNYLDFDRNMALIIASAAFTQYAAFSFPPVSIARYHCDSMRSSADLILVIVL